MFFSLIPFLFLQINSQYVSTTAFPTLQPTAIPTPEAAIILFEPSWDVSYSATFLNGDYNGDMQGRMEDSLFQATKVEKDRIQSDITDNGVSYTVSGVVKFYEKNHTEAKRFYHEFSKNAPKVLEESGQMIYFYGKPIDWYASIEYNQNAADLPKALAAFAAAISMCCFLCCAFGLFGLGGMIFAVLYQMWKRDRTVRRRFQGHRSFTQRVQAIPVQATPVQRNSRGYTRVATASVASHPIPTVATVVNPRRVVTARVVSISDQKSSIPVATPVPRAIAVGSVSQQSAYPMGSAPHPSAFQVETDDYELGEL